MDLRKASSATARISQMNTFRKTKILKAINELRAFKSSENVTSNSVPLQGHYGMENKVDTTSAVLSANNKQAGNVISKERAGVEESTASIRSKRSLETGHASSGYVSHHTNQANNKQAGKVISKERAGVEESTASIRTKRSLETGHASSGYVSRHTNQKSCESCVSDSGIPIPGPPVSSDSSHSTISLENIVEGLHLMRQVIDRQKSMHCQETIEDQQEQMLAVRNYCKMALAEINTILIDLSVKSQFSVQGRARETLSVKSTNSEAGSTTSDSTTASLSPLCDIAGIRYNGRYISHLPCIIGDDVETVELHKQCCQYRSSSITPDLLIAAPTVLSSTVQLDMSEDDEEKVVSTSCIEKSLDCHQQGRDAARTTIDSSITKLVDVPLNDDNPIVITCSNENRGIKEEKKEGRKHRQRSFFKRALSTLFSCFKRKRN